MTERLEKDEPYCSSFSQRVISYTTSKSSWRGNENPKLWNKKKETVSFGQETQICY
jgi:hypothetical protein